MSSEESETAIGQILPKNTLNESLVFSDLCCPNPSFFFLAHHDRTPLVKSILIGC